MQVAAPDGCTGAYTLFIQESRPVIAGRVIAAVPGTVVAGIRVLFTAGAATNVVVIGADGSYSNAVMDNWSGTVTPTNLPYWVFAPTNRTYVSVIADQAGEDYVATPDDFADTFAGAAPIGCGTNVDATLERAGDVDTFRVRLRAGYRYRITVTGGALPNPVILLSGPAPA